MTCRSCSSLSAKIEELKHRKCFDCGDRSPMYCNACVGGAIKQKHLSEARQEVIEEIRRTARTIRSYITKERFEDFNIQDKKHDAQANILYRFAKELEEKEILKALESSKEATGE